MELLIHFVIDMQEHRPGRDTSRKDLDSQQDNHIVVKTNDKHLNEGTSDTSEGDTSRNHQQPTTWR